MQTLSCSPELPGCPGTPGRHREQLWVERSSLHRHLLQERYFPSRGINLNLSLTRNIPVSRAFVWSWEWFGYCCTLLGWQCLRREKWGILHRWEWGCWDGDVGSPASRVDGALPNQAVIRMRVGSRLWRQLAPCPSCPPGSWSSLHKPS